MTRGSDNVFADLGFSDFQGLSHRSDSHDPRWGMVGLMDFRKAVMRHSHRHFQFNTVHAIDQFLRVNLLVKEAPELVVDCKHVWHDLAGDLLKLFLCDALRASEQHDAQIRN